jgi:hypothetical protein
VSILHPYQTLLRPLSDWKFSHFLMFVTYMNWTFFLDSDPVTSLQGTRSWTRRTQWEMPVVHAFVSLIDRFKCLVDESGHLDNPKQCLF